MVRTDVSVLLELLDLCNIFFFYSDDDRRSDSKRFFYYLRISFSIFNDFFFYLHLPRVSTTQSPMFKFSRFFHSKMQNKTIFSQCWSSSNSYDIFQKSIVLYLHLHYYTLWYFNRKLHKIVKKSYKNRKNRIKS